MKLLVMSLLMWSGLAWSYNFGFPGRDGRNGYNGRNGDQGRSVTVNAEGQALTLNLQGSDAADAGSGENGSDASSCFQRRGRFNERGANGGSGGDGGNGGNGGSGGDVTVYYKNAADLKNIFINNEGGRAGRAGRGGYAGRGCDCYDRTWSHRICRTEQRCSERRVCDSNNQNCRTQRTCRPVNICRNEIYTCTDGMRGRDGRHGIAGNNGEYGQLKLVQGRDQIPTEHPQVTLTIGQLERADFVLSKQVWRLKNDAHSLFAPGSNISGKYQEFVELRTRMVGVKWNAARDMEDFKDYKIGLQFDGQKLLMDMPEGLFINYELKNNYQNTVIIINDVYTTAELSNLAIASTQGYGSNLVITVNDKANVSDQVKNEVKLQFAHRKWRIWYEVYDRVVPAEFVDASADKLEVHVGKLGIPSAYIARGKLVRYTLWIKRSFGNNVTEVKLNQSAINLR